MSKGTVEIRRLRFESLEGIVQEAERITAPGSTQLGGWTAAQNVQHVAKAMRLAVDGYGDFKPNIFLKLIGPLIKGFVLKLTIKPGQSAPGNLGDLIRPDDDVTNEQAMNELRAVVSDVGTRGWLPRNPVLGAMGPDQWLTFHCRHSELHFGHIVPAS